MPVPTVEPGLEEAVKWKWKVEAGDEGAWGIPIDLPEPVMAEILDCCSIVVLPAVVSDVIDLASICADIVRSCSSSSAMRPRRAASCVAERWSLVGFLPPTDLLVGFKGVLAFENRGTDHALDAFEGAV